MDRVAPGLDGAQHVRTSLLQRRSHRMKTVRPHNAEDLLRLQAVNDRRRQRLGGSWTASDCRK
jgi:hypothetical protein